MERKADDAVESCLQYHTALFRAPGRRHQAGLGQANLIQTAQGHRIHSPLPLLTQVETGTRDGGTVLTHSNLSC